jgi:hypothetical protein
MLWLRHFYSLKLEFVTDRETEIPFDKEVLGNDCERRFFKEV